MSSSPDSGIVHLGSPRLESVLRSRGLTVVARVDHSGEAEKVGLAMHPTQLQSVVA